jgi:DNA-binding CsgD family transcriptional regulator
MNLFIGIHKQEISEHLYLMIPFLAISILSYFLKIKTLASIAFMIAALYSAIDQGNGVDYPGVVFFVLFYSLYKTNIMGVVVIVISIISICLRTLIYDLELYESLKLFIAYSASYYFFYHFIFKKKAYKPENFTSSEYERLVLYSQGYTFEQICAKLKLSLQLYTFNRQMKELMRKSECSNLVEFGRTMHKMGIID